MASYDKQVSKTPGASMRRSFTLPIRPLDPVGADRSKVTANPNPQIRTLFTHPSVRIVSFTASSSSIARPSLGDSSVEEDAGTLPWTSNLERLIAVGPMSLYKGPGGVAFLSCGKVMQPILPKSQCWCVDDASTKFVLQIRRPQYYRIELPLPNSEDLGAPESLKEVLCEVLLLEKTPCPFQRSFTVELPEPPVTPLKKQPWRPVHKLEKSTENTSLPDVTPKALRKADKADHYFSKVPGERNEGGGLGSKGNLIDDTIDASGNASHQSTLSFTPKKESDIATEFVRGVRSVTAPPLTIVTSSLSETSRSTSPNGRSVGVTSVSSNCSSSVNSFHTVQSWHSPVTPLPPSPPESNPTSPQLYPYPHHNILLPKRPDRNRETSELTVTPGSPRVWEMSRSASDTSIGQQYQECSTPPPKTPTLVDDFEENLDEDHFEIITPSIIPQLIRQRVVTKSNSNHRGLSPLPPPANLFSPSRQRPRHLQTARHLPTAIIQKTCEILLSPPSHLIRLMLDIASRITAGEWRGMVFSSSEDSEDIIGQWDYDDNDNELGEWEEDDFGNSFGGKQEPVANNLRDGLGRSWEID